MPRSEGIETYDAIKNLITFDCDPERMPRSEGIETNVFQFPCLRIR